MSSAEGGWRELIRTVHAVNTAPRDSRRSNACHQGDESMTHSTRAAQ